MTYQQNSITRENRSLDVKSLHTLVIKVNEEACKAAKQAIDMPTMEGQQKETQNPG